MSSTEGEIESGANQLRQKIEQYSSSVLESPQFKKEEKYLNSLTDHFIEAIRIIARHSTRAKYIYEEQMTIAASDDLLQSSVGIRSLVLNGIQNMAKRELRYLIEMIVKYLVVDQELSGQKLSNKTQYLADNIPSSSIDVVERMKTNFSPIEEKEFRDEIRDFFYKACAYVHPSQRQIEEQISNYSKGYAIGFESVKSLSDICRSVFRCYDLVLTILFIGFGQSMSKDVFENALDDRKEWKFHKGKYVSRVRRYLG